MVSEDSSPITNIHIRPNIGGDMPLNWEHYEETFNLPVYMLYY